MYDFTIQDADDFTPRSEQGATHCLKLRDRIDAHTSQTHSHGLTDAELVGLYYAVGERLSERYSDMREHFDGAPALKRGAW